MTNLYHVIVGQEVTEEVIEYVVPPPPPPPAPIPPPPEVRQPQTASKEEIEAQQQARERQRQQAAGATGRSDTILTGPLGVPGDVPGRKKTLLGL